MNLYSSSISSYLNEVTLDYLYTESIDIKNFKVINIDYTSLAAPLIPVITDEISNKIIEKYGLPNLSQEEFYKFILDSVVVIFKAVLETITLELDPDARFTIAVTPELLDVDILSDLSETILRLYNLDVLNYDVYYLILNAFYNNINQNLHRVNEVSIFYPVKFIVEEFKELTPYGEIAIVPLYWLKNRRENLFTLTVIVIATREDLLLPKK